MERMKGQADLVQGGPQRADRHAEPPGILATAHVWLLIRQTYDCLDQQGLRFTHALDADTGGGACHRVIGGFHGQFGHPLQSVDPSHADMKADPGAAVTAAD